METERFSEEESDGTKKARSLSLSLERERERNPRISAILFY
jgi:hypothetical protein